MQKLRHHHILDRAKDFLLCWKSQAPGATFAGIKEAKLTAEYEKTKQAHEAVALAEAHLKACRLTRNQANRRLASLLIRFATGVRGHAKFGTNSAFYQALGFVTDDHHRGGRPRKVRSK